MNTNETTTTATAEDAAARAREERARNRWLETVAARLGVATVATGNAHAHARRRAHLQDALVAVGRNETLEESEPHRRGNAAGPSGRCLCDGWESQAGPGGRPHRIGG